MSAPTSFCAGSVGAPAQGLDLRAKGEGARREQQGNAQGRSHQRAELRRIGMPQAQGPQRKQCGRHRAHRHRADDRPGNVAAPRIGPGAAGLGDGGEQQVGAHGDLRRHAEEQGQERRHK